MISPTSPYTSYNKNKMKKAWQEMVSGSFVQGSLSDEIFESWKLCLEQNVNPFQKVISNLLSYDDLEELRKKNEQFINVSRPAMESVFNLISHEGLIVALSDKDGYLLEVFGDPESCVDVQEGRWIPGADCSEKSAGNNIVGTPIRTNKPVILIGYEHYCRCSHHYGGAGAPIHDTKGEIIGTISISCKIEDIHLHTLGIIVAIAKAVETQFGMREAWNERDVAYHFRNLIIENIKDGIIFADENNIINFSNYKTFDILNTTEAQLLNKKLDEIVEPIYANRLKNTIKGVTDDEVIFTIGNHHHVKCIVTSNHIINKGQFIGTVLILRDYSRTIRLTERMIMKGANWTFFQMSGNSSKFKYSVREAKFAAKTESNILLLGESGVGKDLFAQSIHNESLRRKGPYVAINCGAIPKELIASELFGYSEGAFSGAKKGGNKGKFEMASGGTIFFDEIGEMPLEQQIALLRVLEEKSVVRVGTSVNIPVDVRVIAATNKDLKEEVSQKRFRPDLYYRLNVFSLHIPPLRERKEDIAILTERYLKAISNKYNYPFYSLPNNVMESLMSYDWPGNVRELQNVLERAFIVANGKPIQIEHLNIPFTDGKTRQSQEIVLREDIGYSSSKNVATFESKLIQQVLRRNRWNITKACEELKMSRTTLYRKLKKYNIDLERTDYSRK